MEHPWFKAKRYGYGWYPATWQGWLVMLVWVAALVRLVFFFVAQMRATQNAANLFWFVPLVVLLVLAVTFVAWLTGEPSRWRWGDDK